MKNNITTTKNKIIFDIDSSSVGGVLVQYGYTNDNKLVSTAELFSLRENITDGTQYDFDEYFKRTLKTLNSVAEKMYLESLVPIEKIIINLATPWASSQKRILRHEFKKPTVVTQEFVKEMVQHDTEISFKNNRDYSDHEVVLIESNTIATFGNGYPTRTIIDKEMTTIEVHMLTSVVSETTQRFFNEIVENVFHRQPEYISNTHLELKEFQTELPNVDNAIILNISGEVTEVFVIQHDYLTHHGSIPVGDYSIVRSIHTELNIPWEKAKKIIQLHHNDHIDNESNNNIEVAVHNGFKHWFKEFYGLMDDYAQKGLLPHTLLVHTHPETQPWFEEMLMAEETLREHIHTQGAIEIIKIPLKLERMHSSDVHLGILAQYCEKI